MRADDYNNPKIRMRKSFHIFPRIWKAIGDVAKGNSYDDYRDKLSELEENNPIAIRHLVQTKQTKHVVPTEEVSIGIKTMIFHLLLVLCHLVLKTKLPFAHMQKRPMTKYD